MCVCCCVVSIAQDSRDKCMVVLLEIGEELKENTEERFNKRADKWGLFENTKLSK